MLLSVSIRNAGLTSRPRSSRWLACYSVAFTLLLASGDPLVLLKTSSSSTSLGSFFEIALVRTRDTTDRASILVGSNGRSAGKHDRRDEDGKKRRRDI